MSDTDTNHTPGPWSYKPSEHGDVIWIGNDDENAACVPGYADHPGNLANARLIAQAPALLDIAKQARACVGFMVMTATAETNRVNGKKFLAEIEAVIAAVENGAHTPDE